MSLLATDFMTRARMDGGGREALVCAKGALSEAELLAAVRARVAKFRSLGVARGDRVSICVPKGPASVECLFAAMLCGAIAVPLDPTSPIARLQAMVAEVEPVVVVTDGGRRDLLDAHPSATLLTDGATPPADLSAADFEPVDLSADDDALILMTSGSTGTPKGITITHGNITAFSDWAIETFGLTPEDRFLSIAPLHFDLSVLDVLTSQRIGASVYLASEIQASFPAELTRAIETHRTTIVYTVPTALRFMLSHGGLATRDTGSVRWILFAGEVFPAPALRALMDTLPAPRYANLYGPTETNVITCDMIDAPPAEDAAPGIGSPCAHSVVDIRDERGVVLPAGEVGEICVSGPTVMKGYWRRPELDRDRFLAGDRRAYRTGDLGCFEADGSIRFLGRRDSQIKHRGYRIDLMEIEAVAMQAGGLAGTAGVMATGDDGASVLCLHVVPRSGMTVDTAALRRSLAVRLPKYALPDRIVIRDCLPVTSTGKIDRTTLRLESLEGLADEKETYHG